MTIINTNTKNDTNDTLHARDERAFQDRGHQHPAKDPQSYRTPVDVYEANDRFIVLADMPGTASDSIEITVDGNSLEISGKVEDRYEQLGSVTHQEYGIGDYHRYFRIGSGIVADDITATYSEGILKMSLPKQNTVKTRTVQVVEG